MAAVGIAALVVTAIVATVLVVKAVAWPQPGRGVGRSRWPSLAGIRPRWRQFVTTLANRSESPRGAALAGLRTVSGLFTRWRLPRREALLADARVGWAVWRLRWGCTPFARWLRGKLGITSPRLPIVLVHGLCGFDELRLAGRDITYFRGVRDRLRELSADVHVVQLPPVASVEERAKVLARHLEQLGDRRVNIIAHSLGGLDARFAIARLGLGNRIASVITIGTPHHGTSVADAGWSVVSAMPIPGKNGMIRESLSAILDLTTKRAMAFNRDIPNDRRVFYGCVVSRVNLGAQDLHPLLRATHGFVRRREGDNDGLVAASSQRWGELLVECDIDHWGQIGWSKAYDPWPVYRRLFHELGVRGL